MSYPIGRPPKHGRGNTVPPDRYIAPTGELKVDHYAIWRRVHMPKILAILEWAEERQKAYDEKHSTNDGL